MSTTHSDHRSCLSVVFLGILTLCFASFRQAQTVSGPTELTVLTYNTHLFERTQPVMFKPEKTYYEDTMRRHRILERIRTSGADVVALQELWDYDMQSYFIKELHGTYPHAARVNSICAAPGKLLTIGNGLLLLSKWPLSDIKFKRFPTYTTTLIPDDHDCWANKGVLTATALVGDKKLRLGISHALTGEDDNKGEMASDYVAIAPFSLRDHSYILALHKSVGANIFRIDDYGLSRGVKERLHAAGKQLLKYGARMSPNYVAVTSFQLNGHPYIFGLHRDVGANIWRINDDPSTGFTLVKEGMKMSPSYGTIGSFQLKGRPYIFGLHRDVGANIWRINDDPSTGFTLVKQGIKMSPNYVAVTLFYLKGHPYIFGLHRDLGANIWRINDDPSTGFTLVKQGIKMSPNYRTVASFQLKGHPYIFGLHSDVGANIWRINDDPSTGFTLIKQGGAWAADYGFVRFLEMQGHPYLFGLKNCCGQYRDACLRPRPGEAYITRINDDPSTGWEDCAQMEDVRMIAGETGVADGPPAIMMGDFNVHATKYPIMDTIFSLAGARDAYVAVHGKNLENAETLDVPSNKLALHFDPEKTSRTESSFDRIDYIYVKESGTGFRLIPVEARVIRDWKYDDGAVPDMDLSDHYPLAVKFRIQSGAE